MPAPGTGPDQEFAPAARLGTCSWGGLGTGLDWDLQLGFSTAIAPETWLVCVRTALGLGGDAAMLCCPWEVAESMTTRA